MIGDAVGGGLIVVITTASKGKLLPSRWEVHLVLKDCVLSTYYGPEGVWHNLSNRILGHAFVAFLVLSDFLLQFRTLKPESLLADVYGPGRA